MTKRMRFLGGLVLAAGSAAPMTAQVPSAAEEAATFEAVQQDGPRAALPALELAVAQEKAQVHSDASHARRDAARLRREVAGIRRGMAGARREAASMSRQAASMSRDAAGIRRELEAVRRQEARSLRDRADRPLDALSWELLEVEAPPAWLQQDPGDSIYRAGRQALNDRDYRRAAHLFGSLLEEYPESGYAPDAYYYQAFALYRAGRIDDMNEAKALLETVIDEFPDASTISEAERLLVRVEAEMARRGDAESTRRLVDQASASCDGKDYEVRAMALSALINMDSDRAMPILMEVLRNRNDCPELRKQAVFLVSQHGGPDVVDLMLDLAHRNPDPDPEVRSQAVFWLSQVDSPEAVDALESILRGSEDQEVQEQALFALSQHDSDRALNILREFAERRDAPEELRGNAIFWLSQNSDLGADYLIGLWDDVESRELREKIIFGMTQTDDPRAAAWLLERVRDRDLDMDLRTNALFWVAQGDVEVDDLMGLFHSMPETEMREQILFGLSQIDNRESVDALMTIARDGDDPDLQEKAIFWLGQSEDPRVADFLMELIRR